MVALADVDARLTLPPYEPATVVVVHVPLNWPGAMEESSAGTRVNFGPLAQPPQTPALQARTRNWYALPVVGPTARYTRVLVAVVLESVTGVHAPRLAVLFPVAICSSEVPPPFVHVRSTGSLLLASGENSWIGSLKTAARLWTGAVEAGAGAAGVVPDSARVWSVLFAASSPNDRLACRVPAAVGLNATLTVTLLPGSTIDPLAVAGMVRTKSPGFRPARYARPRCSGDVPLFVIVTSCVALVLPTAIVANFGAADRATFGAGTSAGPEVQPAMPALGPPAMAAPFS